MSAVYTGPLRTFVRQDDSPREKSTSKPDQQNGQMAYHFHNHDYLLDKRGYSPFYSTKHLPEQEHAGSLTLKPLAYSRSVQVACSRCQSTNTAVQQALQQIV